jgi:predicted dehydrogenase
VRPGSPSPTVAVAGCGAWGRNLVRNFAALDALAAVVDDDQQRADEASSATGAPVRSWAAVLDDASIDGVVIAAPAVLHGRLAAEALEAGKDVFVEKPLALEIADAEHLRDAIGAGDRVLMVGHLLQYHPAFIALRSLVDDGQLGALQYTYSTRLNLGRFRREENILWSFAPHDISMILSLVGREPSRVDAIGHAYLTAGLADVTTTHLEFDHGVGAHVFVSWLHPFKEQRLVVIGARGMAVFDDGQPWTSKLVVYPHVVVERDGVHAADRADAVPVELDAAEPLELECRHFLDCISTRERPRTDVDEGLRVLRVLDAAQRSMGRVPA